MIKIKIGTTEKLLPIIFPDMLVHADIFKLVEYNLRKEHDLNDIKVHSAGQIALDDVSCFGNSETLKTKAVERDAEIIEDYGIFYGIVS